MEYDKDTTEALETGRRAADIVKSEDWNYLKGIFNAKVEDLRNGFDTKQDAESLGLDVKVRYEAVQVLEDFIAEVEGRAEQFENNKDLLPPKNSLYSRT